MMTNEEMLETALRQSATDLNCAVGDLLGEGRTVVRSVSLPGHRTYLHLPFFCNLVTYGNGVVASVSAEAEEAVRGYLAEIPDAYACFETPALLLLADALRPLGHRPCFMAEYFLPDARVLRPLSCGYELRVLGQADFAELYEGPSWRHALCRERREMDVLGVGAYDGGGRLVGLAACSADCETMWQIGVDVLPACRRRGVASAVTSRLAVEILERGRVPFYCAAWSNVRSVRNAVRSGFRPAWVEATALPEATALSLARGE